MKRILSLFRIRLFQILLFFFAVLLFNWPLLRLLTDDSLSISFPRLYFGWFCTILLLILLGKNLRKKPLTSAADTEG